MTRDVVIECIGLTLADDCNSEDSTMMARPSRRDKPREDVVASPYVLSTTLRNGQGHDCSFESAVYTM